MRFIRTNLESLWQDVRHGGRVLAKNPGFTTIVVLSLAIGTGANTFALRNQCGRDSRNCCAAA
jgi:hypothetical protein